MSGQPARHLRHRFPGQLRFARGPGRKGDALLCDRKLHASLVAGALRSTARTVRFRHNDLDHLERCLRKRNILGSRPNSRAFSI
jgi:7-keto-8-aminopelargonate synthetase-like enzyme